MGCYAELRKWNKTTILQSTAAVLIEVLLEQMQDAIQAIDEEEHQSFINLYYSLPLPPSVLLKTILTVVSVSMALL